METDSLFCQLFKLLPETMFELLGEPAARAKWYRFDSIELKKALRIDGLFLPRKPNLPLFFVEVQFQRAETFYANLFAKVFCFLEENRPEQEWIAVAIFPTRRQEPKHLGPYEDLLASKRVKRVYLDELVLPADPSIGREILHLINTSEQETQILAAPLMRKVESEIPDLGQRQNVVQLIEGLLVRRFPNLKREEIRAMILHDIRKSKAVQEVMQEVRQEGIEKGQSMAMRKMAKKLLASGKSLPEIAEFLEVPLSEARKWTQN